MSAPFSYIWPDNEKFEKDPVSYLSDAYESLAEEVYDPVWRLRGSMVVPAGSEFVFVAAEIDRLPAEVFVTPSWNTTVWVTDKKDASVPPPSGFTVDFGTAPAGDETIDWLVIVSEAGA